MPHICPVNSPEAKLHLQQFVSEKIAAVRMMYVFQYVSLHSHFLSLSIYAVYGLVKCEGIAEASKKQLLNQLFYANLESQIDKYVIQTYHVSIVSPIILSFLSPMLWLDSLLS